MNIFCEERIVSPGYNLVLRPMGDVRVAVEKIIKMTDFALHHVSTELLSTPNNFMLRDRLMLSRNSRVPRFKSYLSDPERAVPGGFIVDSDEVYYCADALGHHENRDAVHGLQPDGKNFYTTLGLRAMLEILTENRTLRRADFVFANSVVVLGKNITLDQVFS